MLFFLSRLLARLGFLRSWVTPLAVIVFVFLTSWPLMVLAEPAGSELVKPANFWWYFVVSAATVGYGDFSPTTAAGHLVGGYLIVGGIVALTTVFTKIVSVLDKAKGRLMRGMLATDASGHVVLLGYRAGRTGRIAADLLADGGHRVVLCAWDEVAEHPLPEHALEFVRGDLTDEEVLRRAGVHRAGTVLVDVRNDNEALAVALVVAHLNPTAHKVVTLRDLSRAPLVGHVDSGIRCVQWHSPRMITEELISPGIAEVYAELMTAGGANTYSVTLPESLGPVLVDHCQTALGRSHGAVVIAVRAGDHLVVNPGWYTELVPGSILYYIASKRLTVGQIRDALRNHDVPQPPRPHERVNDRTPRAAARGPTTPTILAPMRGWSEPQLACKAALRVMPRPVRGRASSAPVTELRQNSRPSAPEHADALTVSPDGSAIFEPAVR